MLRDLKPRTPDRDLSWNWQYRTLSTPAGLFLHKKQKNEEKELKKLERKERTTEKENKYTRKKDVLDKEQDKEKWKMIIMMMCAEKSTDFPFTKKYEFDSF